MKSKKLPYLLRMLWNNPIFGDSYPMSSFENTTMGQFKEIYPHFVEIVSPIFEKGMPETNQAEVKEIINQIAPKSIAFCASISAGEICDLEKLAQAAAAIAVLYWADQSMDRGDQAMISAVQQIARTMRESQPLPQEADKIVLARRVGLKHIEQMAYQINQHPDDFPFILQAIHLDVLDNEARVCHLSQVYHHDGLKSSFWDKYSAEIAQKMVFNSGLMSALTLIYAIYRHYDTTIPSLREIYQDEVLMALVKQKFNTAIRIFDDWGDRHIDSGKYPKWGTFTLNIFNQADPQLLKKVIDYSGFDDETVREQLMTTFMNAKEEDWLYIANAYAQLMRDGIANLPQDLFEKYTVFLRLAKRILEAGFINAVGDIFLTEGAHDEHVTMDTLENMFKAVKNADSGRVINTAGSET
jgi:hypothetical protein